MGRHLAEESCSHQGGQEAGSKGPVEETCLYHGTSEAGKQGAQERDAPSQATPVMNPQLCIVLQDLVTFQKAHLWAQEALGDTLNVNQLLINPC